MLTLSGIVGSMKASTVAQYSEQESLDDNIPPRYPTPSLTATSTSMDTESETTPATPSAMHPQPRFTTPVPMGSLEENDLSRYASQNRHLISPDLEYKLRKAHYMPEDDPDEISVEEWRSEYGVGYFELKRLRQLHKL